MRLSGKSIIGFAQGKATDSTFHAVNPATGEALEPAFSNISISEVDQAAVLADSAFSAYAALPPHRRAAFLREIADRIEALGKTLVQRAMAETALPEARIQAETTRTTNQIRMFADLIKEDSWADPRINPGDPDREPLPKPDIRSMLRPLGPVAVFGASNFPLAFSVSGGDTASALAAGCPVVAKAHPSHPGVSELVGSAVRAAAEACGMPDGVFSLIIDARIESGQALVRHPAIRAVGFTGSRRAGIALMEIAAQRPVPIPVFAEMSSVNPVFLLPGALEERADAIAAGLTASCTLGVGQFCTNPGLVFLPTGEAADAFIQSVASQFAEAPPGVPLNVGIHKAYREAVSNRAGIDGVTSRVLPTDDDRANTIRPTLFVTDFTTFLEHPSLAGEIFGPTTLFVRCPDPESMVRAAQSFEGQLTATLHFAGDELELHLPLVRVLESVAGRVLFNGFPTGVEVGPAIVHGGPFPATSDGRSSSVGTHAISRFCRLIAWQDAPSAILPPALR